MYRPLPQCSHTYRFDGFEADAAAGELHKDGVKVPLQDVPFRLLVALLEHPGEVRSRDQLRAEIWPEDVHLDFDAALATTVHKVRQALGDETDHPRFIETIPGRGYRFLVPVVKEAVETAPAPPLGAPRAPASVPDARVRRRIPRWLVAAAVAGLALGLAIPGVLRSRTIGPRPIRSIAVLPLEYLGNAPDSEPFVDGMTDAISTELGRIPGFDKVISWQSMKGYKRTAKSLGAIAKELEVEALVQGTVQRQGAQVRISARLYRTDPEQQVWAWSYDRDAREVLALQREVAEEIAREVQGSLSVQKARKPQPAVAPEAYELYLRGVQHIERGLDRTAVFAAVRLFEQAVAKEPGFAKGHAALSGAYLTLWFFHHDRTPARLQSALDSAHRSLQLDRSDARGHLALGRVLYQGFLDYPGALAELEAARRVDPNNSGVEEIAASIFRRQGGWSEAIRHFERALALNPRRGSLHYHLGATLGMCRRYAEAETQFQQALLLQPQGQIFAGRANYALWSGRAELARSTLEEARRTGHRHPMLSHGRFQLEMWSGRPEMALAGLAEEPQEALDWQWWYLPKALLQAQALGLQGRTAEARHQYELARQVLEEKSRSDPKDDRFPGALGIACAGLDRPEEAMAAGRKALALLPLQKDVFREVNRRADLARIYAMVGRHEDALKELDGLLTIPSHFTVHALKHDPAWAPLRGARGYQDLLRKHGG